MTPGTDYEYSFYMTNENTTNVAQIEPFINGVSVGTAVSANGTFLTDGWQQFAFTWNSGLATSADLSLQNLRVTGTGNDFAIDTIELLVIPEPSTAFLLASSLLGLAYRQRRHRRAANRSHL